MGNKILRLADIDIYEVGVTIQIAGAVYSDGKKAYVLLFPTEQAHNLEIEYLNLSKEDWNTFVRQTDLMEREVIGKASDGTLAKIIIRKSTRQIDQRTSWAVWKRDGYRCRYCGSDHALTVDHLVTWEEGGPSTEANLLSACPRCNGLRGNTPYEEWINSPEYKRVSKSLTATQQHENARVATTLGSIPRRIHSKTR